MLTSALLPLVVVYSTCLSKYTFEEGYTPQDDAHVAFLISKWNDNKGYLKFNYIAFLENVWACLLKAETYLSKLANTLAIQVVNFLNLFTWFLLPLCFL